MFITCLIQTSYRLWAPKRLGRHLIQFDGTIWSDFKEIILDVAFALEVYEIIEPPVIDAQTSSNSGQNDDSEQPNAGKKLSVPDITV